MMFQAYPPKVAVNEQGTSMLRATAESTAGISARGVTSKLRSHQKSAFRKAGDSLSH
jgi:hypothetical protein